MRNLWQDIRYAARRLRKSPGFTLTVIITLALGIGISAAMFTVVDGVLLRPLPVPHSSQIVALGEENRTGDIQSSSLPNIRDWRAQSKSFQEIAWDTLGFFDLKKEDGSVQFSFNAKTSANFFSALQAQPQMGRTFLPSLGEIANAGTVVLGNYVWKNNFHSDPSILGKSIQLGANTYTVIGVMPPHFYLPLDDNGPIVWTVLTPTSEMEKRDNGFLNAIGRLRPGVTIAAAHAELSGIQSHLSKQDVSEPWKKKVAVKDYRDTLVGSVRHALLALQGAVLMVWLIACANIAGLMLTRMAGRRGEIAVCAALGAPRHRIVQQFLAEGLLLGTGSGALGLAIANAILTALHHSLNATLRRSNDIALNGHVILMLIFLSAVSVMIFSVAPAYQAASADPQEVLREGSRTAGTGRKQLYLRNALIVGELALSLMLLVSAGLLLRTLYALRRVNLGFNTTHLVIGQFFPPNSSLNFSVHEKDSGADIRETIYKPLLERVRQLPGVQSAALMSMSPLSPNSHYRDSFAVIGDPLANKAHRSVQLHAVTPETYSTLQIRLLQGRLFGAQDHLGSPAVVVVNQAFAQTYLGTQPIGKRLNLDLGSSEKSVLKDATVIGVVENTPQDAVGTPSAPEVDIDLDQIPPGDDFDPIFSMGMQLVVRTEQAPKLLVATISRTLAQSNAGFLINSVQTEQEKIDGLMGSQVFAARLLWMFAIAAVLIAAAGLYGLLSYNVSQRTRDIGVQIALGAQREDILRLILRQAFHLLVAGISLGVVCAYFAVRLVRSFLYGVDPHDMLTILAVSILLVAVGLLASYIPARRAAQIEPMEALRSK